jgi:hypothetical protein
MIAEKRKLLFFFLDKEIVQWGNTEKAAEAYGC